MELFLNFLWALIALVALGVWRACWMREQRSERRDPVREWAAVVCALVLLFFAVSLSDDLHASLAPLEESAAGRRHSVIWNAANSSPDAAKQIPHQPVAALEHLVSFPLLSNLASPVLVDKGYLCIVDSGRPPARAPPYFPLTPHAS